MDDLYDLRAWTIHNGGTCHPDAEFARTPDAGNFLRVKGDSPGIPINSKPVTCPHSITISHLNALDTPPFECRGPQLPESFLKRSTIHTIGVFFLCQQYLLGGKSFWWPYIRTLPQPGDKNALNTPMWYSREERRWLQRTNMIKGCQDREKDWKERWTNGIGLLRESDWSSAGYTWELACWAATIFSSRSFVSTLLLEMKTPSLTDDTGGNIINRDNPFPVLFPLVDILNHSPTTRIEWSIGPSALSLVTLDEICPGQPITNNYGPKSNEELLLGYGFCLKDNPFDRFGLKFKPPLTPKQQSVLQLLLSSNAISELPSDDVYYISLPPKHVSVHGESMLELGSFDIRLVTLMSILVSNHNEVETLRTSPDLTPRQGIAVAMQLKLAIEARLYALGTYDVPSRPENKRQEHARLYWCSQKDILNSSLKTLEDSIVEATQETADPDVVPEFLSLKYAIEMLQHKRNWDMFLEQYFGSTSLDQLRNAGWEDVLWVLWLGIMYLTRDDHNPRDYGISTIHMWLDRIINQYYDPGSVGDDARIDSMTKMVATEKVDEVMTILAEHRDSLTTAASPFARSGWTRTMITWACLVIHEETLKIDVLGKIAAQLFLHIGNLPKSPVRLPRHPVRSDERSRR